MKKLITIFTIVALSTFQAQTWKTDDQYIQNFAKYAVEEMESYKIPASITLAQGLLETGGGQSRLAQEGKNHFGIKCKENWTGKTMKHTDDAPNECFRVYDDVRDSYRDHSLFLSMRPYYKSLFTLDIKDYKSWAHGLKRAGYATNPRYAYILIDKIEKYKLYEFDYISSNKVNETLAKLYSGYQYQKDEIKIKEPDVYVATPTIEQKPTKEIALKNLIVKNHPNGGIKYIVIPQNKISVADISRKFGIKESKLLKYNDLSSSQLVENQTIFLEKKKSEGTIETYKATSNDTMYMISQKFGIRLSKLYARNRMNPGEKIKSGQVIYLQGKRPR